MKTRQNLRMLLGLVAGAFMIFTTSCENEEANSKKLPTVITLDASDITQSTAISGGNVTDDKGGAITSRGVCWSTNDEPTIGDFKTEDGSGAGSFVSNITNLERDTKYYIRAYATNSEGTGYGSTVSFTTESLVIGSFTDSRDGNSYKTVTIDEKVWMAENLKYLPAVHNPYHLTSSSPAYFVYGYTGTDVEEAKTILNYNNYGVLYNWNATLGGAEGSASSPSGIQGVCPEGWHVPSSTEWNELIDFLGGRQEAGGKLKGEGNSHWNNPNTNASDEFEFNALPGGVNTSSGDFYGLGNIGCFWSSTMNSVTYSPFYLRLSYDTGNAEVYMTPDEGGLSVRCVKD